VTVLHQDMGDTRSLKTSVTLMANQGICSARPAALAQRHVSALEIEAFGVRDIDAAALLHCELHAAAPSGQLALKPSEKADGLLV
jgi:hypothetical protein